MDSEDKYIDFQDGHIINNKKRGDILSYSISQVAALLDQEDSSIRYYTNVFDNILKIEISDKELRYTNRDIDKLEFLINLKNKGMTIKEVQKYCEELPLDIEDLIEVKENTSISAKEIVEIIAKSENEQLDDIKKYLTNKIDESNESSVEKIVQSISKSKNEQLDNIKESLTNKIDENNELSIKKIVELISKSKNEQLDNIKEFLTSKIDESNELSVKKIVELTSKSKNEQLDNIKESLTNKINENNELSVKKIVQLIGEEQNKQLNFFKEDILNEIKEYINSKLDIENTINPDSYSEFSIKIDNLISEKLSIEDNIKLQLDKFNQISASRDRNLIEEIKRFKNVIERAYYVQQEVDTQKKKISFIGRLLGTR